jgi:hypothetical protein
MYDVSACLDGKLIGYRWAVVIYSQIHLPQIHDSMVKESDVKRGVKCSFLHLLKST